MPKNIVLFSDGTGNSAAKLFRTNVWRTYQALDLSPGANQIAFYDDGVGTSSFQPLALLGSAIGWGLARNVRELYAFVCRNYQPGDTIYMFGFSRGAFTIRVVNGMIASQGLVKNGGGERDLRRKVKWAFRAYRRKYPTVLPTVFVLRWLRDLAVRGKEKAFGQAAYDRDDNHPPYSPEGNEVAGEGWDAYSKSSESKQVRVRFLGLWDTVDAYGLPTDEMTHGWDKWVWPLSMRDRDLWAGNEKACHALALDDERQTFHPILWNEAPAAQPGRAVKHVVQPQNAANIKDERLTQVWFSGVHSNVGGGYADDGLAYVPLQWMIKEARDYGLKFRAHAVQAIDARGAALSFNASSGAAPEIETGGNACGPLYDPRSGFGAYYRYMPRKLARLTNDSKPGVALGIGGRSVENVVKIARPKIHHSVFDRIGRDGDGYAPIVLPDNYAVVKADGSIVDATAGPAPSEPTGAPAARTVMQERVWDLVWWRRIAYFSTLFVTLLLVLLPWIKGGEKCVDSDLCFAAGIPKLLSWFLPAFASRWIDSFSANPGFFAILVGLIAALMIASSFLDAAIKDGMRKLWKAASSAVQPGQELSGLWSFRESAPYRGAIRLFKHYLLPNAFGFMALATLFYAPVVTAGRVWFSLTDAGGNYCEATKDAKEVTGMSPVGAKTLFDTTKLCWASGLELSEGARYRVTLQASETQWCDNGLKADLTGNRESMNPAIAVLAWPVKRLVGENYLKPIARIGYSDPEDDGKVSGQDEYVLDPAMPAAKKERLHILVSDITAQSSGEMFLYVNDAIVPFAPNITYANNSGKAKVWVERLRPGIEPAKPPPEEEIGDCPSP